MCSGVVAVLRPRLGRGFRALSLYPIEMHSTPVVLARCCNWGSCPVSLCKDHPSAVDVQEDAFWRLTVLRLQDSAWNGAVRIQGWYRVWFGGVEERGGREGSFACSAHLTKFGRSDLVEPSTSAHDE